MKKAKKVISIISILLSILLISPLSYTKTIAEEISNVSNGDNVRLQDDFYDAVNSEWLKTANIENGQSTESTFDDVQKQVNTQIKDIISNLLVNSSKYEENSDEKKIINIYNNTLNTEARNNDGIRPLNDILNQIKSVETIDELTDLWKNKNIVNSTIKFSVEKDIKNVKTNILYISPTILTLGDADNYTNAKDTGSKQKNATKEYYNKILMLSGYTKEQAEIKVNDMFKFEEMVAKNIKGNEEKSNSDDIINDMYNVYTLNELNNLAPNLNLREIMKYLGIDKAEKIVLEDPEWLVEFNKIYVKENIPLIKNYLEIVNIVSASDYLSEDFYNANKEYVKSLLGTKGNTEKEDVAIDNVNLMMGMPLGKIYAERYVKKETKESVENLTKNIIEVYKKRINNLDWMSQATKNNAIEKLNKMKIRIGYPEKWDDYSNVNIKSYEEGGSLYQNVLEIRKFTRDKMFSRLNKSVNANESEFKPQTVNAFYSATDNSIIIPGGIIQGHFYNLNNSIEENLGGIGAIVGHEISHAFDNTGAQYDADGNRNNWWTDKDYSEFTKRTQKVAEFYSQIDAIPGQKINGNITVGENIADIGGVSSLLDILKGMDNPNYKKFFESYAVTWRQITTKEYAEYALLVDVHSPNKVRVNAVLPQFKEFYDTYGITSKDGMYLKPEDRIGIW